MAKSFKEMRKEMSEARRGSRGAPAWAKTASLGLLAKVNSDANAVKANDDPKIRDSKLASAITATASIATLGIAINTKDKSMLSRAKSIGKRK